MADTNTIRAEESSLSSWAGPYVTEMLGRGQALAGLGYQQYGDLLLRASLRLKIKHIKDLARFKCLLATWGLLVLGVVLQVQVTPHLRQLKRQREKRALTLQLLVTYYRNT